jgi:hypothetical protein
MISTEVFDIIGSLPQGGWHRIYACTGSWGNGLSGSYHIKNKGGQQSSNSLTGSGEFIVLNSLSIDGKARIHGC